MDLTPVASDPAVDFQAPIRVSESNSMDPARLVALAVTSQPLLEPVPADAGDRVDLAAVAAAAEVAAVDPVALPEEAVVEAAFQGAEALAVDEVVVGEDGAVPAAEDEAARMRPLSAIAPGVPPTRSGPSYSSPRETRCWTRGRSRSTVKCRTRALMPTTVTA